jgi:hypothetical protein
MKRNLGDAMKLTGDRNQCPSCGLHFNSTAAFDKHRTGKFETGRRCRTQDEMTGAGMALRADGFWVSAPNPKWAEVAA